MAANRLTQTPGELPLKGPGPNARITQGPGELVVQAVPPPNSRLTQVPVELLMPSFFASPNQIVGGNFQDAVGNRIAYGHLVMELSVETAWSGNQILGGLILTVPLDGQGNVAGTVYVYPNNVLTPVGTYYKVSVFAADGMQVWKKPHYQTVPSGPVPYNISNWIPST